jgi:hypothetical protein
MARLLRVQFPGAIYHVTVRGNERRLIFRDDPNRGRFLERLAQSQGLYSVRLYLVCLMPKVGAPTGAMRVWNRIGPLSTMPRYELWWRKAWRRITELTWRQVWPAMMRSLHSSTAKHG